MLAPDWLARQLRAWFDDAPPPSGRVGRGERDAAGHRRRRRPAGGAHRAGCKGFDERGVVFYTNYDSAKGRDLAANPYAAAVFAWLPLERQVRLPRPGRARSARAETEAYFAGRPRGSQLGRVGLAAVAAWSPSGPSWTTRSERSRRGSPAPTIPAPPSWGGYRIAPT